MRLLEIRETGLVEKGLRELTAMALPEEMRRRLREHVTQIVRLAGQGALLFEDPNPRTARTVGLYRDLQACQEAAAWLAEHSASEVSKADFRRMAADLEAVVEASRRTVPVEYLERAARQRCGPRGDP